MGRKCSKCGKMGHNSRTCSSKKGELIGSFRLFGVQLLHRPHSSTSCNSSQSPMKKKVSAECLSSFCATAASSSTPSSSSSSSRVTFDDHGQYHKLPGGYNNLFDCPIARSQERKKGMPWTEEEHRIFLVGLEKLGKGDWRGISNNFVTTRTPTQVASHAQKYFLRQNSLHKTKRPSLFDLIFQTQYSTLIDENLITKSRHQKFNSNCSLPDLDLTLSC